MTKMKCGRQLQIKDCRISRNRLTIAFPCILVVYFTRNQAAAMCVDPISSTVSRVFAYARIDYMLCLK